jgi:hypothetical protein
MIKRLHNLLVDGVLLVALVQHCASPSRSCFRNEPDGRTLNNAG